MGSTRRDADKRPDGTHATLRARSRPWRRKVALTIAPELKQELQRLRRRAGRARAKAVAATPSPSAASPVQTSAPSVPPPTYTFPEPSMTRHEFLRALHERLSPRSYVEVGVYLGDSLSVAACPSIGIDPAYRITAEIRCPLMLYKTTSDDYFTTMSPRDHFGGLPVDLGFIDGMHLAEYAYRDFMNLERASGPGSVFLMDDMLPRDIDEAARDRHTKAWTGDVYKVAEVLRALRPDLAVISLNTSPTGTVLVLGLDAQSEVLAEAYDSKLDYLLAPDPQQVPQHVLDRDGALDPAGVLASSFWPRLADLRDSGAGAEEIRSAIDSCDFVVAARHAAGSAAGSVSLDS